MNVLLLSMPDSFEHMPPVAIRMPNGALAVARRQRRPASPRRHRRSRSSRRVRVGATVERLVRELQPDVVGLSVMTFQRATALRIARAGPRASPRTRASSSAATIRASPRRPTKRADASTSSSAARASRRSANCCARSSMAATVAAIAGLSLAATGALVRTTPIGRSPGSHRAAALPNRAARVLGGLHAARPAVDVVETSRGCTFDCSFCSIIEMRGRNFHPYRSSACIADIADAARAARGPSSSSTTTSRWTSRGSKRCARRSSRAASTTSDYIVQAMTVAARRARRDARAADAARGVPLRVPRIENVLDDDLAFLKARAKNAQRATRPHGRQRRRSTAIEHLHRHGLFVVGGLIVGNPDDTRDSIEANLAFARRYVDWPYIQHPTPYPRTPMTEEFRRRGLIVDEDVAHYDGTTAVVRTEHVAADEIEFLRWREERWMKLRHLPAAFPTARVSCSGTGSRCCGTLSPARRCDRCWAWRRAPRLRAVPRHPPPRARCRQPPGPAGRGARRFRGQRSAASPSVVESHDVRREMNCSRW